MSRELGPIHHWLYRKIGNQEALTQALAEKAAASGWISDAGAFTKTLPELESVIDTENIHGWLQEQIADAETRYANLVTTVTASAPERMIGLYAAAFAFGQQHALSKGTELLSVFQDFENFFVNGMPCDRVNRLVAQSDREVVWEQTIDIHAPYWTKNPAGTEPYYQLRNCVMDGMLAATDLQVRSDEDGRFIITYR